MGLGHGKLPLPGRCSDNPKGAPALVPWNSSVADSLSRNMFPANLVEATFKQVSGSLGSGGVGRHSQRALPGNSRFAQPVSQPPEEQDAPGEGRWEDLDPECLLWPHPCPGFQLFMKNYEKPQLGTRSALFTPVLTQTPSLSVLTFTLPRGRASPCPGGGN